MDSIQHLRTDREDCLVGDCIAAASVLEWSTGTTLQDYQPLGGSMTAAALNSIAGDLGDAYSRSDAPWTFELEAAKPGDEPAGPLWRRVS